MKCSGGREFRVPAADEVSEICCVLTELPQELSGLLSDPCGGGVSGDARDVDGAGGHLHDEQCVEALQADGVDMEEIGGEPGVGLGLEEGSPLTARRLAARRGTETGGTQHPPHGGGADFEPEAAQFTVHAPESPSGVLSAETDDQVADLLGQRRPPGRRRLRPLLLHQALVPGQQGAW
jgi:hypothetical protein